MAADAGGDGRIQDIIAAEHEVVEQPFGRAQDRPADQRFFVAAAIHQH